MMLALLFLCLLPLLRGQELFALYGQTNMNATSGGNSLSIWSLSLSPTAGSITWVTSIATTGAGSSPVASQHALCSNGQFIFVVNAGSDSVSMFMTSSSDPTSVTLITTAPSGGNFPVSCAATSDYFCVTNSGVSNGVSCAPYTASGFGTWRTVSFGLTLTTPPSGPHIGPSQVSFTPAGDGVVVVVKGLQPPVYYIPISSGLITTQPTTSASSGSVNFAFDFALNSNNDIAIVDVSPYNNGTGVIGVAIPSVTFRTSGYFLPPGQTGGCWLAWAPTVQYFYVVNTGTAKLSELTYSGGTFTIVNTYPIPLKTTDIIVVTTGGVDYLILNAGPDVTFFNANTGTFIGNSSRTDGGGPGIASVMLTPPPPPPPPSPPTPPSPPSTPPAGGLSSSLVAGLLFNLSLLLLLVLHF